jgi:hypothetical protein
MERVIGYRSVGVGEIRRGERAIYLQEEEYCKGEIIVDWYLHAPLARRGGMPSVSKFCIEICEV